MTWHGVTWFGTCPCGLPFISLCRCGWVPSQDWKRHATPSTSAIWFPPLSK